MFTAKSESIGASFREASPGLLGDCKACPALGPGLTPPSALSSVSTIRNQRYHIHANLSFAVLVAQVLLLVSFHCQPGTVSTPPAPL